MQETVTGHGPVPVALEALTRRDALAAFFTARCLIITLNFYVPTEPAECPESDTCLTGKAEQSSYRPLATSGVPYVLLVGTRVAYPNRHAQPTSDARSTAAGPAVCA